MNKQVLKHERSLRRVNRTRTKLSLQTELPRLSVFRSLRHIYAQIIDDQKGIVLAAAHDFETKGTKKEKANLVGELIAEKALKAKVEKVKFDRGSYQYHGRVASLAEGARKKGLNF